MKYLLVLQAIILISGCTFFTRPLDQPVIEEKLNPKWAEPGTVGTLSLTPERRVVLVNFKTNKFCAEAPTETGIDVSKAIEFAATVASKGKHEAGLNAISASAQNNAVLNRRTQGMQLYLASSYFICQLYMNGGIEGNEAYLLQEKILLNVKELIKEEIKYMYENKAHYPLNHKASDTTSPRESSSITNLN